MGNYIDGLMCFNFTGLVLEGKEEENRSQNINVILKVLQKFCSDDNCEPPDDMKIDHILTVTNERLFNPENYSADPFVKQSIFTKHFINHAMDRRVKYNVRQQVIEDDKYSLISLPGFTEDESTGFSLEHHQSSAAEPKTLDGYGTYYLQEKLALIIQHTRDTNKIHRFIYTYADAFDSTGGLSGILVYVGYLFVSTLNYNSAENYLASRLYSAKPGNRLNPGS